MQRAALFLLVGIGIGAAGGLYYAAHRAPAGVVLDANDLALPAAEDRTASPSAEVPGSKPRESKVAEPRVIEALAANPEGTVQRAALYVAAARSDAREIEALLGQADALGDKATREFALGVLLARYAELDPRGGVVAATGLKMPPATLAGLYRAWLKSSPAAALAALAQLDDPKAASIAQGLMAQIGNDEALVDRVIATLPSRMAAGLATASLVRLAQDSPTTALERARKIADPGMRSSAVGQVLRVWAQQDPRAALDYAQTMDAAAQHDAFAYGMWQHVAEADPGLLLDRIDSLPVDLRDGIGQAALGQLAQRDPQAALARLAQMPHGAMYQQLVQSVAQSFARRDAGAALAWARSLQPPEPGAVTGVVAVIAEKDPMRARDLAAETSAPTERAQALQSVAFTAVNRDPTTTGALLERVLGLPDNQDRQRLVQTLVSTWAARDPASAAEWFVANAAHAPAGAAGAVASQYARVDPATAASYTGRLPSEARGAWVRGVAGSYAQTDPRAALDWVEQLRGSAEYDDAAAAVIQPATQFDPAAAARVVESIGREDYRRSAALTLAMNWAGRDPVAAASWAASLRDPMSRQAAVPAVAQRWVTQDAPAAQAWILSQQPGPPRDAALLAVITGSARSGTPDPSLLSAFSSDQTRTSAVQATAFAIAQRDPEGARSFVTANVGDPLQRDRILTFLANIPNMSQAGVVRGPGGAIFMPPGGVQIQNGVMFGPTVPGGSVDVAQGSVQRAAPSPPRTSSQRN